MQKCFVFDLDDTLIDNVHDYSEPLLDGCKIMIRALGSKAPHVNQIIALEHEIDSRRVTEINPKTGKPFYWSMERFPGTLVEVYRTICERTHNVPVVKVEKDLYAAGLRSFDDARYGENIKRGVFETLRFLEDQEDKLVLCSKGDPQVQHRKVAALQHAHCNRFSFTRIVDEKTTNVFLEIANQFPGHHFFSVGNSYKSDILPALAVGYMGIYIPVETWETLGKMDEILADVNPGQCYVFRSIEEIMVRYGELK